VVNIRNLFDSFPLTDKIPCIMCKTDLDGKTVKLSKTFKNTASSKTYIPLNCILFVIKGLENDMNLIIKYNGEYIIQSSWNAVSKLGFNDIYKIIKVNVHPLINKINSYINIPLVQLYEGNATFNNINITIFWKIDVSPSNFRQIITQLDQFSKAGIIYKTQTAGDVYYFLKGMNIYNKYNSNVNNEYSYLVDDTYAHRFNFIKRQKLMDISHRFSDIQINMSGLKESEYMRFYMYITYFTQSIKLSKNVQVDTLKKLKVLKEKDPKLYDFKKLYNSPLVYARICQQPKQPVSYNTPGKGRVKYWNFTSNEHAYYECPNKNYPYINFITGMHPRGYCIPCCYKLPPPSDGKGAEKYKTCIEKHEIKQESSSLTISRYVTSYSKTLESGRLSNLPDDTLLPLFYDTYSRNSEGMDTECEIDDGHFIFGAPQHIQNVTYIGAVFSISHAMNMNLIEYIDLVLVKLKENKNNWNILLGGTVMNHFESVDNLCDTINNIFINNEFNSFTLWNELFIDITMQYLGISIVLFIDFGEIYLHVPDTVKHVEEYKINNEYIVLIQRDKLFHPVYQLNKDLFYKNGTITSRLYNSNDDAIAEIYNIVSYTIQQNTMGTIDLFLLKSFVTQSDYVIDTQYINTANFCYGVTLRRIENKPRGEEYTELIDEYNNLNSKSRTPLIFISIAESRYTPDHTQLSFEIFDSKYSNWNSMNLFISSFNGFIKSQIQSMPYISISIQEWIIYQPLQSKKQIVVGFKSNGLSQWIDDITLQEAKEIADVKYYRVFYRQNEIFNVLYDKPVEDDRTMNINESLYETHLYTLLIIHLRNIVYSTQNKPMRTKIINILTASTIDFSKLRELLIDFPNDYNNIYKLTTISKKEMLNIIDGSYYDFDKKLFNSFKLLQHGELVTKLKEVFSDIVINKKPTFKTAEFSNILSPCPSNNVYCDSKKLMITTDRLYPLLNILASDILNPIKSDIILNPVTSIDNIDYFKFISRVNESIIITI